MPETRIEEKNKAVVRHFLEALNRLDFDRLDEVASPDLVRHCQATPDVRVRSLEDFKNFLRNDAETFPDAHMTMDIMIAERDLVSFYGSYSGTQNGPMGPFPASGRHMTIECSGVLRLESGRIAEIWITWDNLAALAQLGHLILHPRHQE